MTEIAVKFLGGSDPVGIRPLTTVPAVQSVQVAHVLTSIDGAHQEHVVVNTHPEKPNRTECLAIVGEIQRTYQGAVVSVILEDIPGSAVIFATRAPVETSRAIAAAVSCMKAVWGWDESETFEIRVNDHAVSLRLVALDGNAWSRFAC